MVDYESVELRIHCGNSGGDGKIRCVAVAQREVVGDSNHLNAMGEVLVALSTHILLESRRGCSSTIDLTVKDEVFT